MLTACLILLHDSDKKRWHQIAWGKCHSTKGTDFKALDDPGLTDKKNKSRITADNIFRRHFICDKCHTYIVEMSMKALGEFKR